MRYDMAGKSIFVVLGFKVNNVGFFTFLSLTISFSEN